MKVGIVIGRQQRERLFRKETCEQIDALGDVVWAEYDGSGSVEEAVELLQGCEVGVGSWRTPHPGQAELFAACPELKGWIHAAGSVKFIFGNPQVIERKLRVGSCAPAIAKTVAEFTVGALIAGLRRSFDNALANRYGAGGKPDHCRFLATSTIGVVGLGQVGREVVRLLRCFGTKIMVYDPFLTEKEAEALGVGCCGDLLALCQQVDALTLHVPALPQTQKMLRREHWQALSDHAVFVNTSRGVCIDQDSLTEELGKGRLTAFLDVSVPEPLPSDHPLRQLPNCYYSNHIAGGASPLIGEQVYRDLCAWQRGEHFTMEVTVADLERLA